MITLMSLEIKIGFDREVAPIIIEYYIIKNIQIITLVKVNQ